MLGLAAETRQALGGIAGLRVYGSELAGGPGAHEVDATILVVDVRDLGLSGYEADEWLQAERKVSAVLSDLRHLGFSFSLGTTREDVDRMVAALHDLATFAATRPTRFHPVPDTVAGYAALWRTDWEIAMTPALAAAAPFEHVSYARAAGRIAGQAVAIVPPAVPRLLPGQRITPAHVAFLDTNLAAGAFILDPDEQGDGLVRVVKES